MVRERNVARFDADVDGGFGYLYTRERLSCRLANQRMSDCVAELGDLAGKRVLDLGCGDGTYSAELLELGAAEVLGVDAASRAVRAAARRYRGLARLRFKVLNVYDLRPLRRRHDLVVVRGVLHHLYDLEAALKALAPLARSAVIVEPNGYNPVLKLNERFSRYHIEHEEKSYLPHRLDASLKRAGGRVVARRHIGTVPMFCPDWLARALKSCEPWVEALPGLRNLVCGQYVIKVEFP